MPNVCELNARSQVAVEMEPPVERFPAREVLPLVLVDLEAIQLIPPLLHLVELRLNNPQVALLVSQPLLAHHHHQLPEEPRLPSQPDQLPQQSLQATTLPQGVNHHQGNHLAPALSSVSNVKWKTALWQQWMFLLRLNHSMPTCLMIRLDL